MKKTESDATLVPASTPVPASTNESDPTLVPASTPVPASFVPDESDPTLVPASTPVPASIHDSFAEEEEVIQELDINFIIKKNFPLPLIFFVHDTYSVSGHYNSWSKEA